MVPQKDISISKRLRDRATLVQRGSARAAVLGVNDGLVSTVCLVVAVAATGASAHTVLTAGLAGMLAGAISMAAGEWISVKAQVELFEGVLGDLKIAMSEDKEHLVEALAHALAGRGMDEATAHQAASDIAKDDEHFSALYAAQVIGMNTEELGSPWRAAISSFVLFVAGALVPLAPWFFINGSTAIAASVVLTSLGGLGVGAFVARSSGKNMSSGALRQLLIILGSSVITYALGYAFGVSVSR
jgi:VIT1/CCC1 family predicted Fe2+/Mn2+ transporter